MFVCLQCWENSPYARSTGTEERRSNREAACLLPYGRPPRPQKKTKKTTLVPGRTLKSQAAESKTIPTETHGEKKKTKNCEEEDARKVVRLFGRGEAVFFWRNFERRFQFLRFASGGTSMLSADAPAARPIRLHPKTGFNWRSSALLAFGSLDGWFRKRISLSPSASPSLPLSLSPPPLFPSPSFALRAQQISCTIAPRLAQLWFLFLSSAKQSRFMSLFVASPQQIAAKVTQWEVLHCFSEEKNVQMFGSSGLIFGHFTRFLTSKCFLTFTASF